MRLADKIATMARRGAPLPYDAEVEWLSNGGTAFFDAEIKPRSDMTLRAVLRIGEYVARSSYVIGCRHGSTSLTRMEMAATTTYPGDVSFFYGGYDPFRRCKIKGSSFVDISVDRNGVTCDGVFNAFADSPRNPDATKSPSVFIFSSCDESGDPFGICDDVVQIKAASIFLGDSTVRDFVSVRFTNESGVSEGAMYDRVSGQLFRNAGTVSFVI